MRGGAAESGRVLEANRKQRLKDRRAFLKSLEQDPAVKVYRQEKAKNPRHAKTWKVRA